MLSFCLFLLFAFQSHVAAKAQVVGFSIVKSADVPGAILALPGSVRRINLRCTSGCSLAGVARWSVAGSTGGASATIVPSSTGNSAEITLGPGAASCPIVPAGSVYTVQAAATVTVKATSADDSVTTDSVVFDVCKPSVEAYTVPFYRVLYSGQREDVQGVIWGATNTDGIWSMLSQPSGGDGVLDDYNNRDAVFHATVKGLYKIKFMSSADPSKTAYSTFFVTGNKAPRNVQPNGTEPIDCTVDPNAGGPTLEVGPSQLYKNLEAIAPGNTVPGTTIRLHNEDTTGKNPTTYHEWIQINAAGTHDKPIRLCGVADAAGNLPVIDGDNATARGDIVSAAYISGYAGILTYQKTYDRYPGYTGPQYVLVEGVAIRHFAPPYKFHPAGDPTTLVPYSNGATGMRFQICRDCELNGSEVANNGNGVFSEANDSSAWGAISMRLLFEGNNVHDNGNANSYSEHNWYVQAWFQVVQFNQTPTYNPAAFGSMYKDRGITWFRYNMIGAGGARIMDFVEDQDAPNYLDPVHYLTGFRTADPRDAYTGDQLAAVGEAWHHSAFVYGNVFESASGHSIHFWSDVLGGALGRVGTLEFYNNTFAGIPSGGMYRFTLFDTGDNGSSFPHLEWPTIHVANIAMGGWSSSAKPFFSWNSVRETYMNFDKVQLPPNWGTDSRNCTDNSLGFCDGSGWPFDTNKDAYFGGSTLSTTGTNNFTASKTSLPWDTSTYQLTTYTAGLPLRGEQAKLPVRFQYLPASKYAVPRGTVVTSTTGGEIGGVDVVSTSPLVIVPLPVMAPRTAPGH